MTLTINDLTTLKRLLNEECSYILNNEVMDCFLNGGEVISLKRNEILCRTGEIDPNIYIIIEGIGRMWYEESDREITKFFSMPGTLILSYHSYYFNKPLFYNVSAATPAKILRVPREHYDKLISENHEFARWCLSMAQCQLYYLEYKDAAIKGTARERYEALLKKRPLIIREISLNIISTYLGITPQYLSKLRKELK